MLLAQNNKWPEGTLIATFEVSVQTLCSTNILVANRPQPAQQGVNLQNSVLAQYNGYIFKRIWQTFILQRLVEEER